MTSKGVPNLKPSALCSITIPQYSLILSSTRERMLSPETAQNLLDDNDDGKPPDFSTKSLDGEMPRTRCRSGHRGTRSINDFTFEHPSVRLTKRSGAAMLNTPFFSQDEDSVTFIPLFTILPSQSSIGIHSLTSVDAGILRGPMALGTKVTTEAPLRYSMIPAACVRASMGNSSFVNFIC